MKLKPCKYNRECAYANEFPFLVKGHVVSMQIIFAEKGSMSVGRKNFGWMVVWVLRQCVSVASAKDLSKCWVLLLNNPATGF
jgi:hypothetical protein